MAYEAKTQNDLAKWWVIGTGSVVNRFSEIMDDCPLGPAIYYTTGWANIPPSLEYSRAVATQPDSAAEKIGAGAWTALTPGVVGSLNAGEWGYAAGTLWVRLTGDVVPNATNQTRAHYLWDGSGAGPPIMTEVIENGVYQIHLSVEYGDGTTATTLTSLQELVWYDTGIYWTVKAAATVTLGTTEYNYAKTGSTWSWAPGNDSGYTVNGTNAVLNVYGSVLQKRDYKRTYVYTGTFNLISVILDGGWYSTNTTATVTAKRVTFQSSNCYFQTSCAITFNDAQMYYISANNVSITLSNCIFVSGTGYATPLVYGGHTIYIVDPIGSFAVSHIGDASSYLQFTVNIHVADKTGTDLSGATVTWLDSQSNTGNDTTDVNGDVSFTLTSKKWVGTSETETDFNTFTFTISKIGYQTLVLENITLSEAIDWHLELQDPSATVGLNNNFSHMIRINA